MDREVGGALLSGVRASPEDWQRWLVYADWLTETGDVRGQLVSWAHELATSALSAEARVALQQQSAALAEEHEEQWLSGWARPAGARLHWRHGFVGVWLRWDDETVANLEALVAHPTARTSRSHAGGVGERLDALCVRPHVDAHFPSPMGRGQGWGE
jgi:uncharacterized protein (TIGR02996 family)